MPQRLGDCWVTVMLSTILTAASITVPSGGRTKRFVFSFWPLPPYDATDLFLIFLFRLTAFQIGKDHPLAISGSHCGGTPCDTESCTHTSAHLTVWLHPCCDLRLPILQDEQVSPFPRVSPLPTAGERRLTVQSPMAPGCAGSVCSWLRTGCLARSPQAQPYAESDSTLTLSLLCSLASDI